MRLEVRFAGFGGQGVITAGRLLALIIMEADPGLYVVYSPSYGFQTRGGDALSDVIISDKEIDYPKARKLDLAFMLTQQSYGKYCGFVKDDGLIVIDEHVTKEASCSGKRHQELSIITNARHIGSDVFVSTIVLGAALYYLSDTELLRGKVSLELARQVVIKYFRETLLGRRGNTEDVINRNIKALGLGYGITQKSVSIK
ncbi:2-oxoacid:acceptor oxidoreductase family protein [Vulcanisaeta souniana]|uniref:2-oxoglutarate ferredoxin oxidoreductase subunit gamma n=1 Tax=Vulcanisaeta souniana JCM 11219 TaxID=1293586 RepID=A0A830E0P8_9CREN|nr:2-oxoacid:acceptor oxidoreductase family protein [Vulcanisaeta souniana]BDR91703.1 2-oxoglutarate ferredoxin oxidoreductase subunit gamma [Vulcanisaeta souniana JCM 11219]GGI71114.1 2-oxoglutarate ferredoxin oxidoreductase subunit gamma [Vulcanisaeta souniana JCM 11219]